MTDEDQEPNEPQYKRLKESEQRTKVTRDWSIPCWAGTSDKLVTVQRLAEDCLEKAFKEDVAYIKAEISPVSQESWIEDAVEEYALRVSVAASEGRITKTGELSTIFADTDLRDVVAVTMANDKLASRGSLAVRLGDMGVRVSALGPDLTWVYGTIEALSAQLVKDRPWWSFVRAGWFAALVSLLLCGGLSSIITPQIGWEGEAGEPAGTGTVIFLGVVFALLASALVTISVTVPLFVYSFPAFEVIERGGQPTGRKVLGGAVAVISFGISLAGLILSLT